VKKNLVILLAILAVSFVNGEEYAYPIKNPLYSTIAGSPPKISMKVEDAPVRVHKVESLSRKELPEIMWDIAKAEFSTAVQKEKAPLIFIIAGTGSSYNSSSMEFLQKAFWGAGFHTICISSPISRNFIATCSTSAYPGISSEDSKDIYKLMKSAYDEIKDSIEVSDFHLTGYSLGGLESAFVSKLDETEKAFNFKKVLMINPPVSVYNSITILDNYLTIEDRREKDILTIMMDKMSLYFAERGEIGFGQDALYRIHQLSPITEDEAQRVIGAAFRLFLAEIVFITDILNDKKYIVDEELTTADPLLPYFKESLLWSFGNYLDYYILPYWLESNPGKTKADLIHETSLHAISDYLAKSTKIAVVHNRDDIIVTAQELAFLEKTFSGRNKIYPVGGHCGNMQFTPNAEYIINYFK